MWFSVYRSRGTSSSSILSWKCRKIHLQNGYGHKQNKKQQQPSTIMINSIRKKRPKVVWKRVQHCPYTTVTKIRCIYKIRQCGIIKTATISCFGDSPSQPQDIIAYISRQHCIHVCEFCQNIRNKEWLQAGQCLVPKSAIGHQQQILCSHLCLKPVIVLEIFSNQWERDIYLTKVFNSEKCFTETSQSL